MNAKTSPAPLVRNAADAERRWFYGGGVVTWLAKAEDTADEFLLFETAMEKGKVTPLHTHPADETMYVVDGEILMHMAGEEFPVTKGGITFAPRGVPHAFKVVSEGGASVVCLHTPGTCAAFYMEASEPMDAGATSGQVDFDRIRAAGESTGGMGFVGPPPFGP